MYTGSTPAPSFTRPARSVMAAISRISSSDACDAGAEALHLGLLPYGPGRRIAGPLLTVAAATDDNLAVHAAVEWAKPGDVIAVASVGGRSALVGELVSLRAKEQGVAGFVVSGFVRDVDALALPVFARGTSPARPACEHMGAVGVPIVFGGVRLSSGDILIYDGDGAARIPAESAREILERAGRVARENALCRRDIVAGREDRTWLHDLLERAAKEETED